MTSDHQHDLDEIATSLASLTPGDQPAILIGWVCIAEYSDLDGHRWLAVRSGSAPDTDHMTTSWQRRGYLDEALTAHWGEHPHADVEDNDDD